MLRVSEERAQPGQLVDLALDLLDRRLEVLLDVLGAAEPLRRDRQELVVVGEKLDSLQDPLLAIEQLAVEEPPTVSPLTIPSALTPSRAASTFSISSKTV